MANKRILSLLLVLSMLFALLCSCGTPKEDSTDTTTTPAADTTTTVEPPESTGPSHIEAPAQLQIVADGKANYKVIRDEDAGSGSSEVAQARAVVNTIKELTGASVALNTDWSKPGYELDSTTMEILVGYTDYPETQEVLRSLSYGDWAVRAVGNKIVIFGFDGTSLSQATMQFNLMMKKAISEDGKNITLAPEEINLSGTKNAQLSVLPAYEGGTFGAYYEAGANCDEIIIRNTNAEQYNAYLKKLEASGFKQYASNQITDNLFATYTNDKYTVTAGYYHYETSARLLIEPLAPAVGLEKDNVYTPVTTSQINMLGVELQKSDGTYSSNGLAVVIRLTDGRFVVVDGGHSTASCARQLYEVMMELSSGYRKAGEKPTVAAWIITHAHGDHYGALINHTNQLSGIKVERFLVNFLSESERQNAIKTYSGNWSASEGNAYTHMPAIAKSFDATLHQVHVGQVFHLADLKMEILYTIESFAPKAANALNTTSTVIRMQFGGSDGTTYISTGDATGNGMEICTKMYGSYLQSDLVQVCHHGYTTWGNDSGIKMAYQAINAPTVLWPQGLHAYPNYKDKSYNAVLFTVPNYQEVYVAGTLGDRITIPIPYTVGSAIVKRVG